MNKRQFLDHNWKLTKIGSVLEISVLKFIVHALIKFFKMILLDTKITCSCISVLIDYENNLLLHTKFESYSLYGFSTKIWLKLHKPAENHIKRTYFTLGNGYQKILTAAWFTHNAEVIEFSYLAFHNGCWIS